MKIEKIVDIFEKNTPNARPYQDRLMSLNEFSWAIEQAELVWYKQLENKLNGIADDCSLIDAFYEYRNEIINNVATKEKGLKNV